jgi:hypothetical protein
MLACMTLALAHSHAAPAFNGLFYATGATVIPVLFLALAVQGRTYEDLLKAISARAARIGTAVELRQRLANAAIVLAALAAVALIIMAGIAEMYAFDALQTGSAQLIDVISVYYAVFVLTLGVVAPPTVSFLKAVWQMDAGPPVIASEREDVATETVLTAPGRAEAVSNQGESVANIGENTSGRGEG